MTTTATKPINTKELQTNNNQYNSLFGDGCRAKSKFGISWNADGYGG